MEENLLIRLHKFTVTTFIKRKKTFSPWTSMGPIDFGYLRENTSLHEGNIQYN